MAGALHGASPGLVWPVGKLSLGLDQFPGPTSGAAGAHLHDPAGAAPCLADVLWSLFCPQSPGDVSAVADFVIRCHKRDLALSLELAADLTMQSLLVRFHRQEEVGPLFPELLKNGFWLWSASAWISTPFRSSSPRSCLSTARSWFSPVAWQAWLIATPSAAE